MTPQPDSTQGEVATDPATGSDLSEISKSVRSLWGRYARQRPEDVVTERRANVIRCTIADAVHSFEQGPAPDEDADGSAAAPASMATYRTEAMMMMGRLTGRRVVALVSDRNTKTDVARETFILEVHSPKV